MHSDFPVIDYGSGGAEHPYRCRRIRRQKETEGFALNEWGASQASGELVFEGFEADEAIGSAGLATLGRKCS
jgi:hypothetical protein